MALMVSISGIRGIFGSALHPENLVTYAAAYGTWLKKGTVVIGRDSRVTGEIVEKIVTATLQSVGCNVISIGIAPTPTVAMNVLKHQAQGGIIISASHNPAQWNALKLLNSKSEFLDANQGEEVIRIAQNKEFSFVNFSEIGSQTFDDKAVDYHIQKILDLPYIDAEQIKNANFSVALDAVNGAGSESIPALLDALGVQTIHKLHCTPNGIFTHNPEPLPEHLTEICELVPNVKADLGIVTDPDADRLAFVDENGRFFGEEYTIAAVNDFYLTKNTGDIAVNLSSSMINDWVAEKHGITCHRAAVGEINVVKTMQATQSVIGGEGNGGVINPDLHYGRDALVGVAMMLQLMAETKQTASEVRNSFPNYFMGKHKAELGTIDADKALEVIQNYYEEYPINTVDGIKILLQKAWIHLRKSNTEPIIRIYTESETQTQADALANEVKAKLLSL